MSGYSEKPWRSVTFIPEIRFRDRKYSIEAWKNLKRSPRVLILNYLDLKKSGFLGKLTSVKKSLGEDSTILLTCVGEDRLLDSLKIEEYYKTAELLDVEAIISPDDYIYKIDYRYPTYQNYHFARALERTETLIEKAKNRFSIIGLIVWANKCHIRLYFERLRKSGVEDFACACGDPLKRGFKRETLEDIKLFMKHCDNDWQLLLGIDSKAILLKLRPHAFSSSGWSFDAAHSIIHGNGKGRKHSGKHPINWQLALHNLEQDYKVGEEIGRTWKRL